jgi:hypothetical protein
MKDSASLLPGHSEEIGADEETVFCVELDWQLADERCRCRYDQCSESCPDPVTRQFYD